MMNKKLNSVALIFSLVVSILSCTKESKTPSADLCAGKTIVVTGVATVASAVATSDGTITVAASGGVAPYTFSKNGGSSFQTSASYNNLNPGNYTIVAKDANNCTGTSGTITVAFAGCPDITISTTIVNSDKCSNTGSVSITATGSTGLLYNINNGTYQTSNVFGSLATGTYTIGVKDAGGCVKTGSATVGAAAAGPNFLNVKAILAANCALSGCHAGPSPQNGINFADDCTIVSQNLRIKARAVDGNPSFMPPTGTNLSAGDQQKITDWINAGGQYGN
jgi:hypothetical protein